MASVLSNYAGNTVLVALLSRPGLYLGLHVGLGPDVTGTGTINEVAGGGYVRKPIHFSTPSGRTRVSINSQKFPGMPACTVTVLAVWDAISNGHLLFTVSLDDPIEVAASDQFTSTPGDIAISL